MKKFAIGLGCILIAAACADIDSKPKTKPPKIDEARVHAAKIGGRDLKIYTFSARIDDNDNEIVAVRVNYKTGADSYTKSADGVTLNDPVKREGEYHAAQHNVRYISDATKDAELEQYFEAEDTEVSFQFEIDYKEPEAEAVQTVSSNVLHTDREDIDRHNLAADVKP